MGSGRNEVVALAAGKFKKLLGDNAAYCVRASIVFVCVAFPVPVPPCHRVARTGVEGLAKHVEAGEHGPCTTPMHKKACPISKRSSKQPAEGFLAALGSKVRSLTDDSCSQIQFTNFHEKNATLTLAYSPSWRELTTNSPSMKWQCLNNGLVRLFCLQINDK